MYDLPNRSLKIIGAEVRLTVDNDESSGALPSSPLTEGHSFLVSSALSASVHLTRLFKSKHTNNSVLIIGEINMTRVYNIQVQQGQVNPNRIRESNALHIEHGESWATVRNMTTDELAAEPAPVDVDTITAKWFEQASQDELLDMFGSDYDSFLNDIDGDIKVAGCTFQASDILKQMDYEAYRQGFFDYIDMIRDDFPSEDDL